ncbi:MULTISPECIES: VOC family protein [Arenibacter]|nr:MULTISPECIES: VOC family protein [Arenibacter]
MMKNFPFHLSLPSKDLQKTKKFYLEILGASLGRSTDQWIDIDLYQNQITFTKAGDFNFEYKSYRLGTEILPSFHFGIIVDTDLWCKLYARLSPLDLDITTEVTFLEDKVGEHLSFFIQDPNGYMVEFKSFKNNNEIFSTA